MFSNHTHIYLGRRTHRVVEREQVSLSGIHFIEALSRYVAYVTDPTLSQNQLEWAANDVQIMFIQCYYKMHSL